MKTHQTTQPLPKRVTDLNIQTICSKLSLMKTDQFESELTNILREPKRYLIHSVVKYVAKDLILKVLVQTIEIQYQGGMKVQGDDEKQKTPGGVFLTLLKKSKEVPDDIMKRIKNLEKQQSKDKRRTLKMMSSLNIDKIKIPHSLSQSLCELPQLSCELIDTQMSEITNSNNQQQTLPSELNVILQNEQQNTTNQKTSNGIQKRERLKLD
eukprot:403364918